MPTKILTLGLKNYIISGSIIFNIFLHLSNIYVSKYQTLLFMKRKKKENIIKMLLTEQR